jgi:hypothetical protein
MPGKETGEKSMVFQKSLWLLPLVALLSACGVRHNMTDTAQIPSTDGVMVARVVVASVANLYHPPVMLSLIDSHSTVVSNAVMTLNDGENYVVLPLHAGQYSWDSITIGRYYMLFKFGLPFNIVAGKINYVGDIELVLDGRGGANYALRVVDRRRSSLVPMASAYPQLWSTYPVVVNMTRDMRNRPVVSSPTN